MNPRKKKPEPLRPLPASADADLRLLHFAAADALEKAIAAKQALELVLALAGTAQKEAK